MAITKQQKIDQLSELSNQIREAKSVVFAQFSGVSVEKAKKIRRSLAEQGAKMKVIKKTLIKIAAKEVYGLELSDESLQGQIAVICSNDEIVGGPKVIKSFSKDLDIKLTGGIFEEKELSKAQAQELANMLSKDQLIAKMLGSMMAPIQGFYSANKAVLSGFARVLDGHRENLEKQS
ncbi:50S ribosomal protein L10 [Candidatus Gracilibacteria bacterium]|nr:50S ribosomal protein L10 [Candidatus Gracilibacteria bacterium]